MLNCIEEHVNNNERTEICEYIFCIYNLFLLIFYSTNLNFFFFFDTDDSIYTYMMELIALMACHYIETFELEMYLNLFKTSNPPLVR